MHIKQTHIPAAQPNLLKEHVFTTHRMTDKIKHENTTHNIANKGFTGMRRFVARFNFLCILIGNRPQSATRHMRNVMRKQSEKTSHIGSWG
jgi:hypothetical protein